MIKINKFQFKDITIPRDGYIVYKDRWWACVGDEKKALFYGRSPQCNPSKKVAQCVTDGYKDILEKHYKDDIKIVFVPLAYVRHME